MSALQEGFIVVDAGNTSFRMAVYAGGRIVNRMDFPYKPTSPKVANAAISLNKKFSVRGVAVASVQNARATREMVKFLLCAFPGAPVSVISGDMENLPLKIADGFTQKNKIGADRLANAMAAVALKKHPCVIADFGTALTVDGVNAKGEFIGGMILPGMNTMLFSLHIHTDLLPEIKAPPQPFEKPFGQNTKDAMLAGVEHGYRGLVRETVETLKHALCGKCPLLATGGMASRVAPATGLEFEILPDLTLLGIAQVFTPGKTT